MVAATMIAAAIVAVMIIFDKDRELLYDSAMFSDVLILAGGFGERLWPASTASTPKQFMSLEDGVSFFQRAVLRAFLLAPEGRIVVATRGDLLETAGEHCLSLAERLDKERGEELCQRLCLLAEPWPRHTAPPVLLTLKLLEYLEPNPDRSLLILPSDHVISIDDAFCTSVEAAWRHASSGDAFVCFGIEPEGPATEYGYIKRGELISAEDECYAIAAFKEKPDRALAETYITEGYWWNSGMFGFTASFFWDEIAAYSPDLGEAFAGDAGRAKIESVSGIETVRDWPFMWRVYSGLRAVSIDVALAEVSKRARCVKAAFCWSDVGSWDSFERLFVSQAAHTVSIESTNCFVYSDMPVALCGVDDLIVVIKNGRALVLKKGASSLVRLAARESRPDAQTERNGK